MFYCLFIVEKLQNISNFNRFHRSFKFNHLNSKCTNNSIFYTTTFYELLQILTNYSTTFTNFYHLPPIFITFYQFLPNFTNFYHFYHLPRTYYLSPNFILLFSTSHQFCDSNGSSENIYE